MHLNKEAIVTTLRQIATLAPDSMRAMTFLLRPSLLNDRTGGFRPPVSGERS
ncbi:MAG TPA: hypothetical protein VGV14_18235 [Rhodanobacter sp.]|nr:hypothetical protein [Rhodanobacter sp.]